MAENENQEVVVTTNTEVDPWEERAKSMGWNPDKYDKDDENYIDAKEFVRRKPLFDKIEATTKRLRGVEETLNNLAAHHQKVKEIEYQSALRTLRNEKREAMKEGDTVKALEYEERMEELTDGHQKEVLALQQQAMLERQQNSGPSPEFQVWVQGNDWYLNDQEMHDTADGIASAYVARAQAKNQSITEQEVFSYVEKQIKKTFPEKFTNPNRDRPGAVVSGDRGGKGIRGSFTLTAEEDAIARNFEKLGVMTRKEYIEELKQIKGAN